MKDFLEDLLAGLAFFVLAYGLFVVAGLLL